KLGDHADDVPLRVAEQADRGALRNRVRAHHALATEALDLLQRRSHIGDLHIEGDVSVVSLGHAADASGDSHALVVCVAVDHRVVGRPHWLSELPIEEFSEELTQAVWILADDFEMNDRLSHALCPLSCSCGPDPVRAPGPIAPNQTSNEVCRGG